MKTPKEALQEIEDLQNELWRKSNSYPYDHQCREIYVCAGNALAKVLEDFEEIPR